MREHKKRGEGNILRLSFRQLLFWRKISERERERAKERRKRKKKMMLETKEEGKNVVTRFERF